MSRIVRVGLVQSACTPLREQNIEQAIRGIAEAARLGAEVICLQELFAGEYPCQSENHSKFEEAEGIPGPLTNRLSAAAKQHAVVLVGSVFERRAQDSFTIRPSCLRLTERAQGPIARCMSRMIRITTKNFIFHRVTQDFSRYRLAESISDR